MAFSPLAMLSQQEAVVRIDDQKGVLPQIIPVHGIQHPAQVPVAHGKQRRILPAHMVNELRRIPVVHRPIVRPVQQRAPIVIGEQLLIFRLHIEGLVGVKGLQLQKPVVLPVVFLQKVQSPLKGPALALACLLRHERPVGKILAHPVVLRGTAHIGVFRNPVKAHQWCPGIPLLAPDAVPGGVALVIGGPAVLPIVVVVTDQMGMDSGPAQQLRHGVVKGLQGAPAAVEKIVSAGVQLPPGGHTGHAAHIAVVKGHSPLGQPGKIGGFRPVTAVGL